MCNNYKIISGGERAQGSVLKGIMKCDWFHLIPNWYRFQGAAGDRILDKCVPMRRCSTIAPGWMRGNHPTVAEGVVTRKVCYHFDTDCCTWSNNISVKNCGGYFVYELEFTPNCYSRYCGNGGTGKLVSYIFRYCFGFCYLPVVS